MNKVPRSLGVVSPFFFFFLLALSNILIYTQNKDEKFFIHNHLTFTVKYHRDMQTDTARIVGFEVKPFRFVLVICPFLINFLNLLFMQLVVMFCYLFFNF